MTGTTPRQLWEIPGGITPPEHKARSLERPIRNLPLPDELIIPLSQPGYRKPDFLVETGQYVLKGQALARDKQHQGTTVHASSSGTITEISERRVPNASGLPETCARLATDGKDQWGPHTGTTDYSSLAKSELLRIIRDAGISGLGGAGFPSHIKLQNSPTAIHTLIINACECEPFITADTALMQERSPDIMTGIGILLHILQPDHCLLGIEDNKPQAIAALSAACGNEQVNICPVPARYPSGAERQLIRILTGESIPADTLPARHGILCVNVGTAHAIARAVCHGEPLISRITTFTGAALDSPGNVEVRIGTPISFILKHCGLQQERLSRLVMGGSLMGTELTDITVPLIKTSNCVIATSEEELPAPPPAQACIRCGMCAEVCPVILLPQQLYWFARGREHHKAEAHKLFDCIECGACAYVCPSSIPLVQYYRAAKAEIRAERDRHLRGEHAMKRFDFHQQRMEQEKSRQNQRRKERAKLSASQTGRKMSAQDTIQAALARVQAKKNTATRQTGEDK